MCTVEWPCFVVRANLVRQLLLQPCCHSAHCLEAVLAAPVRLTAGAQQDLSAADVLHVGSLRELLDERSCRTMLSRSGAIANAGNLLASRTAGTSLYPRYTVASLPTALIAYIGRWDGDRHSSALEIQPRSTLRCRSPEDGSFRSISRHRTAVRLLPRRDFAFPGPITAIRT